MSVIIKGVDMPESCVKCKFNDDEAKFCRVVARYIPLLNKIPDFCPLVPLPEKHGRLIDADALDAGILQAGFAYALTRRKLRYTPGEVRTVVSHAPTIVPAEGGDK